MMGHGIWGGCCSGLFGGYGGLGIVGSLINLILTIGLIIGVVIFAIWAIRKISAGSRVGDGSKAGSPDQTPLEILKMRYARGEITQKEFQTMGQDLK